MSDSQEFWLLREGPANALMVEPSNPEDIRRAYEIYKGEQPVPATMPFRYAYGRKLYDYIPTTAVWLKLYSEAFFAALEAEKLTGWTSYPVRITGPESVQGLAYRGLVVTGRCGPILTELARPATLLPATAQGRPTPAKFGYFFDERTHDGSDLFLCASGGPMFLTPRAKEALVAHGLTGFSVQEAANDQNMKC